MAARESRPRLQTASGAWQGLDLGFSAPAYIGAERGPEQMIASLRQTILRPPVEIERFHAMFFDHQRSNLGAATLAWGDAAKLSLRMRDLFARALALGSSAIIIAHNHPSGDCRPSASDIEATQRLVWVAKALEIELLDHLIFTESEVFSMRAGSHL